MSSLQNKKSEKVGIQLEVKILIEITSLLNIIKLSKYEKKNFNFYLKASAIRFFLTRLHDMYFNNSGDVNHKDPMDFFHILRFHQKNNLEDFI